MTEYWSWWQGGLALGLFTVLFRVLLSRPVGVSGSWFRVTSSREERQTEQQAQQLAGDSEAMNDAFMAATLEEFGDHTIEVDTKSAQGAVDPQQNQTPASIGQHGVFMLFIFIGGLLSALLSGRFSVDIELSSRFTQLSYGLAPSWIYLLLGGMMVGFGTQMAGGCTTGHGLSGCAQFSASSLAATAVFFVSAVISAVLFVAVVPL